MAIGFTAPQAAFAQIDIFGGGGGGGGSLDSDSGAGGAGGGAGGTAGSNATGAGAGGDGGGGGVATGAGGGGGGGHSTGAGGSGGDAAGGNTIANGGASDTTAGGGGGGGTATGTADGANFASTNVDPDAGADGDSVGGAGGAGGAGGSRATTLTSAAQGQALGAVTITGGGAGSNAVAGTDPGRGGAGGSVTLNGALSSVIFDAASTMTVGASQGVGTADQVLGGAATIDLNNADIQFQNTLTVQGGAAAATINAQSLSVIADGTPASGGLTLGSNLDGATKANVNLGFDAIRATGDGVNTATFTFTVDSGNIDTAADAPTSGAALVSDAVNNISVYLTDGGVFTTATSILGTAYKLNGLYVAGVGNSFNVNANTNSDAAYASYNFDLTGINQANTTDAAAAMVEAATGSLTFAAQPDTVRLYSPNHLTLAAGETIFLIDGLADATPGPAGAIGVLDGSRKNILNGLTNYRFTLNNLDDTGTAQTGAYAHFLGAESNYDPYSDARTASILTLANASRLIERNTRLLARDNEAGVTAIKLAIDGSTGRSKVGSKVDVDTFGANLALGHTLEAGSALLTLGAFIEAGNGNYSTYNFLPTFGHTEGDGESKYFGGGVFAQADFAGGLYLEGSVRGGSVDDEFQNFAGLLGTGYDESSSYFGAHLGLGYKWDASWEGGQFDTYLKGFWTRLSSTDFRLGNGDQVMMDAADSFRTRLGGRYTRTYDNGTQLYAGAAWEHEFDGRADGRILLDGVNRYAWFNNSAESKGSSAFMEAGVLINPNDANYSIDIGLFGLAGQQEGIGGTVGFKFAF
jgi:hypothetical protein